LRHWSQRRERGSCEAFTPSFRWRRRSGGRSTPFVGLRRHGYPTNRSDRWGYRVRISASIGLAIGKLWDRAQKSNEETQTRREWRSSHWPHSLGWCQSINHHQESRLRKHLMSQLDSDGKFSMGSDPYRRFHSLGR